TILWTKKNTENTILELETEVIPKRKENLQAIEDRFTSYKVNRKRQGFDRTEEYPPKLLEERCRAEARIDVANRELEYLKDKLDKFFTQPEQDLEESRILEFGPRGAGQLRNGVLCEIDGQKVTPIKVDDEEILVISSPKSKYFGLSIPDYRKHIMQPWSTARKLNMYNLEKARQKEINEQGFSKINVRFGPRKIHPSSLPEWPGNVKNYLKDATGNE
ncbi:MAG: hypothetical protein IH594_12810, partial [Bacteroidales bacterium]|nr:hypothetical protein [Bacteroidales bacterium]